MKRSHQILIAILAVQVVLSVIVFWPRSAATGQSQPLFADLDSDSIIALSVTDAEDKSITLRKVTGQWVLPEADDYPVSGDKITPLLEEIVGLTSDRLVTRTDASHKQLQVSPNDFQRRIEFETADEQTYAFYLGSSPSYGATHFRVSNQNETYLTSDISVWEVGTTPSSWIDTSYLSIATEEISKMTLENANGVFVFNQGEEGNWSMDGLGADETLDNAKVSAAVRQAASVNISRPLGNVDKPEYGMDQPNATVTLETPDKVVTLLVGSQDPSDNTWVVKSSESPYYVRVSSYTGEQLAQKSVDDFLQVEPTPTPES